MNYIHTIYNILLILYKIIFNKIWKLENFFYEFLFYFQKTNVRGSW